MTTFPKMMLKCFKCGAEWDNYTQQHICGLRQTFMEIMSRDSDIQLLNKIKDLIKESEKPKPVKNFWRLVIWSSERIVYETKVETRQEAIDAMLANNNSQYKQTIVITHKPDGWETL